MKTGDPIYDSYVDKVAPNEDIENSDIEIVNGVAYDTSQFNEKTTKEILSNNESSATLVPDDVYTHVSRQLGIKIG